VTRTADEHYLVKLSTWSGDHDVLTMFVRSGQTAETQVPLGFYRIKYASGRTWYGLRYLFGPETSYAVASHRFDFSTEGRGYTVQLYKQLNGNLKTRTIKASDW